MENNGDDSDSTTSTQLSRIRKRLVKDQKKAGLLTASSDDSDDSDDTKPKAVDLTITTTDSPDVSQLSQPQEPQYAAYQPLQQQQADKYAGLSHPSLGTPFSLDSYAPRTIVPTPTQEHIDHDELAKALLMSTQEAQTNAGVYQIPLPSVAMLPHHLQYQQPVAAHPSLAIRKAPPAAAAKKNKAAPPRKNKKQPAAATEKGSSTSAKATKKPPREKTPLPPELAAFSFQ